MKKIINNKASENPAEDPFAPISKGGFYDSDIDPYEFSDTLVKTRGAADGFTEPFTGPFASLTPCKDMERAEEYVAEMKAGRKNKDTLVW